MSSGSTMVRKFSDTADPDDQFRQMCIYYTSLLQRDGVHVKPFLDPSLPVFSILSAERKRATIGHILSALEVFEATLAEGTSLRNGRRLMWRAVAQMGFMPQSDAFDKLTETDVITIYSNENVLLFQSLNFFDFVSMTLEQLYSNPWSQCSRREAWAVQKLVQVATSLFSGQIGKTFDPEIPEHYCEEVGTEEMLKFYIHIRLISPLWRGRQVSAALVANACRPWDGVLCSGELA
jgi:hypothetical protein